MAAPPAGRLRANKRHYEHRRVQRTLLSGRNAKGYLQHGQERKHKKHGQLLVIMSSHLRKERNNVVGGGGGSTRGRMREGVRK